ncbi:MAG: hypothetical protein AAFV25_17550 [Bacteroidota bacterium]
MKLFGVRPLEIFLLQFVLYLLLWLWSDYIGMLLNLAFAIIFLAVLLISCIVEWIEPSKVPRAYFVFMLVSVCAPLAAILCFWLFFGELSWLE